MTPAHWACFSALLAAIMAGTIVPAGAAPPDASDPALDAALEAIVKRLKVPGMAGAVVEEGGVVALGAAGVRKLGAPEAITTADLFHLGSCTKSMTATLIGRLVDEGKLSWSSTVSQVFPELAPGLHPDFRAVTLDQLLTHRAGLPHDTAYAALDGPTVTAKRLDVVKTVLSKPPVHPPGTSTEYSNVGYIIAGAMVERVCGGPPWEDLVRDRLFRPLGIEHAGFGPPGTPGKVDQPWGHRTIGPVRIPVQSDNPPVVGPAGRVHLSLTDWGRYAAFHLHGHTPVRNGLVLEKSTLEHLHTPPAGTDYACGWVVRPLPWDPDTKAIWHNGSNTMWYAEMWVVPSAGYAVLAATNQYHEAGKKACDEACEALARWHRDRARK